MAKLAPSIESAIENARIRPDARGLMPLAEARKVVASTEIYRKGDGEMIDGTFVLESDRVWAALLSLESAEEFVREASRIKWAFHVRGRDNLAAFERFGDGIVPWLRARIDRGGVLRNVPWCVLPCLLAIDTKDALDVALSARALDEQLPDYSNPGMFAADRHDDAVDEEPDADPLVVARRWMDAHPSRYPWLAERASSGDERAEALLRERAEALGDVVREAIGEELADRFELPRTELPPEARAILEASPIVDEPRGPLWSIAELDAAAREFDLPLWDNTNYTTGAMRVTAFGSREGDVLVVQTIVYHPGAGEPVTREVHAYGPGAKKRSTRKLLVAEDQVESIELGDQARVNGTTNVLAVWGELDEQGKPIKDSRGTRLIPSAFPVDYFVVALDGEDVNVDPHLPDVLGPVDDRLDDLHLITPEEGLLLDVCTHHRERVFLSDDELAKSLAPTDAIRLFSFDDLEWPAAGEPASSSIDLVTIVEALRTRRRIERLPGNANSQPRAWLLEMAGHRYYAGGNAWPPNDFPIARPRPTEGPGKTPYQNLLFTLGWPHGVQLLHGGNHEDMASVRQTLDYLLNAGAPMMHVHWGRRAGTAWVRAIASAESSFTLNDKGVQRALKDERPLFAGEARALLKKFAASRAELPAWCGPDMTFLLEALIGADETVLAFVDAIADADHPALAAAVFELGFLLMRVPEAPHGIPGDRQRAPIRSRSEVRAALVKTAARGATARALGLALGSGTPVSEAEWAYSVGSDARAGLLAAEPSPFDAWLVTIGGDEYLTKVAPRLAQEADWWTVTQLAALRSPVAVAALRTLRDTRPDLAPFFG